MGTHAKSKEALLSELSEVEDLLRSNTDGDEYDALIELRNELNSELSITSSEAA